AVVPLVRDDFLTRHAANVQQPRVGTVAVLLAGRRGRGGNADRRTLGDLDEVWKIAAGNGPQPRPEDHFRRARLLELAARVVRPREAGECDGRLRRLVIMNGDVESNCPEIGVLCRWRVQEILLETWKGYSEGPGGPQLVISALQP